MGTLDPGPIAADNLSQKGVWKLSVYASKDLLKQAEKTLDANKRVLRTSQKRAESRKSAVQRSSFVVDRAVTRLKQAGVLKD